jgi:hypothetical protein
MQNLPPPGTNLRYQNTASNTQSKTQKSGGDVLYYDDELEDLESLGYFKWLVFPFKKSFKFI